MSSKSQFEMFNCSNELQAWIDKLLDALKDRPARTPNPEDSYCLMPVDRQILGLIGEIRDQLRLERRNILPLVQKINHRANMLSENGYIICIGAGWWKLEKIVECVDDCIVLVPLATPTSAQIFVWGENGAQVSNGQVVIASGRCAVWTGLAENVELQALSFLVYNLAGMYH